MLRVILAIILAGTLPAWGAAQQSTVTRVSGQVQFQGSKGGLYILKGVNISLFTLQGRGAIAQALPDSRGFYTFFGVTPGTIYRIRIFESGTQVGGTIFIATGNVTTVPGLLVELADPCLKYYGEGYSSDYIRTKLNVPWRADPTAWLSLARQARWSIGSEPRVDSIAVFTKVYAPFGHVAWVESVDPAQRTFSVTQWNEPGPRRPGVGTCWVTLKFGQETPVLWHFGDSRIQGFITPPQ